VATLYQNYPIALIAKEDLFTREKLRGKRIGISGTYGSSYLGLKAMLADLGLDLSDIQLASIGFTQVAALQGDRVDAVVGYINNEPVRLREQGVTTHTFTLAKGGAIPGVGIMTNRSFFKEKPELLQGFLRATFRGVKAVLDDPAACFQLVVENYLPELEAPARYRTEYRILQATLPFWRSAYVEANGFGQCASRNWENLAKILNEDQPGVYDQWHQWVNRDFSYSLD
jgi:NitT/TauT family transport system substrate-binding protein